MKAEEYNERKEQLKKEFEIKYLELDKEFALSNNPYNTGEIFKDHIGSIIIEKFGIDRGGFGALPSMRYFGIELKKDLTPRKDGSKRWAYQSNKIEE